MTLDTTRISTGFTFLKNAKPKKFAPTFPQLFPSDKSAKLRHSQCEKILEEINEEIQQNIIKDNKTTIDEIINLIKNVKIIDNIPVIYINSELSLPYSAINCREITNLKHAVQLINEINEKCIILNNIECIKSEIINDLLKLISNKISNGTELIFIFTSNGNKEFIFKQLLSKYSISLIDIYEFQVKNTEYIYYNLSYDYMLNLVSYSQVREDISIVKLSIIDYYYTNYLSIFRCKNYDKFITSQHLICVRNLPSFTALMKRFISEEKRDLVEEYSKNDEFLLNEIKIMMNNLDELMYKYKNIFTLLYCFNEGFDVGLKKRASEIYLEMLDGNFISSPFFKHFLRMIFVLANKSRAKLQQLLLTASDKLADGSFADKLIEFSHRLEREDVGGELRDVVNEFISSQYTHYAALPLHELYFLDNFTKVSRQLSPEPRFAIHSALIKPSAQFDEKEDMQLLYQLYRESGRMINVHDLFLSFRSVLDDDVEEKEALARFVRCLTEFQFLGLVKGTQRKADHCMRQVWM